MPTPMKEIRVLEHSECQELIDSLRDQNNRWHLGALLCWKCGLRATELITLRWHQLVLNGTIALELEVATLKRARSFSRHLPLLDDVRKVIANEARHQFSTLDQVPGTHYVFPGRTPKAHATSRAFELAISSTARAVLGKRVYPHMLRHTYGTALARKTNLSTVQVLLGHADISSTRVYTHPNTLDTRQAVERALGKGRGKPTSGSEQQERLP